MPRHSRRRFLTYLVAAPTLAVATKIGLDALAPGDAEGAIPTPPAPADLVDLGDLLILAGKPTASMLVLSVDEEGVAHFRLPREEVGQGLTTAVAMLVAEELDTPLDRVRVQLDDARPELLFNQLTGSSNSIRSLYDPVRHTAAAARARMVGAAARQWDLNASDLTVRQGVVVAPDGRTASYGSLSAAAATLDLGALTVTPKKESDHSLVGTPTSRIDARALVTGKHQYTLDLEVPGAEPCMVRRPPTVNGTVKSVNNEAAVRAMPGVLDVVTIDTGVAVVAKTFGQALDAKNALDVTWGPGTVDELSDDGIRAKLKAATPSLDVLGALVKKVEADFDFAFASHAPMETNSAVADVRADRAEIWSGLKSPIIAQAAVAKVVGLPVSKVKMHVVQSGGSFGRRLFYDAALEAAVVSKKTGRPVRLMWSRIDDMRHGRMRPATHHRVRATYAAGQVLTFQHQVAAVETDFRHGLGDAITAAAAGLPSGLGNATFAQTLFLTTVKSPYNFGLTTQTLTEVPLKMHTGSWRSVYSGNTRGAEEIVVDELAAKLGKDPVAFRRAFLKTARQRAVLDKVAEEGEWGRSLPDGWAQGVGFHEEYKSCTACLVEIDATDPKKPRVTKAVVAADVGRVINPRGLEAQLLGGLTDAISTTLRAGLHLDKGLPLEGSYSQFHYARQKDSPKDVKIFVIEGGDEPGGAGELGVPAAVGAVANAYARATGTKPRSFPVTFDVDFTPFPR
ncbi:xanthine dehydrogenase family protein molybdopterin-binding subunit [Streptomyces sp. NL15-2K]|uniref:xanthine dehydrogenase family protein molybdopterin-binding subunit n=1 Tax=Streptomyces sp. NL15-2K TaxID=376149 RepID=UPI000F55DDEF|nr:MULTISPECIES: molybdopterin cofactor-binding domain-containing protein [Actinomycetes]WKX07644.1 molybdopterin-dependent oxidoreductase [Kutzneria buriramensis]GCB51088.1 isoquinoline 1-oxidoreductase beta subunit [Streptomyces sp. NL15-2K]